MIAGHAHPTSDDALNALMDLPRPYRITVLALMAIPDPLRFEEPDHRRYVDVVTRFAELDRIGELIDNIHRVESLRREARDFDEGQ